MNVLSSDSSSILEDWLERMSLLLSPLSWKCLIAGVISRCEQKSANSGSRTLAASELRARGVLSLLSGTAWAATVESSYGAIE